MNVKERIWKALNHEEPDRVPTFTQTIEPDFITRYKEKKRVKIGLDIQGLKIARIIGYDSKWVHCGWLNEPLREEPEIPPELAKKYLAENRCVEKACIYGIDNDGNKWYSDGILKTPEFLKEWINYLKDFSSADEKQYRRFQRKWKKSIEKGIVPIPTAGGVIYSTWSCIGLSHFAYMMRKHASLVKDMIKARAELTIEQHNGFFEKGIDLMFMCEDYALKGGLMFSPKQFKEFIEPAYKTIAKNAHKHGAKIIVHSDGDITESIPSLIRAGIDAIEPLECESGISLKGIKEEFGEEISLIGGVPASDALCLGNKVDTINYTKKCILDAAEGGGYILSQCANLLGTSKVENVEAMLNTVKNYGPYPINKENIQNKTILPFLKN